MLLLSYPSDACLEELRRVARDLGQHGDGIQLVDLSPDLRAYLLLKDILPHIPAEIGDVSLDKEDVLKTFHVGGGIRIGILDEEIRGYEQAAAPLLIRGYTVDRLETPIQVENILSHDGVILSLDQKNCDALDLLSRLSKRGMPVLALSVRDDRKTVEMARLLGAMEVARKPCPDEIILNFVAGPVRHRTAAAPVAQEPVPPGQRAPGTGRMDAPARKKRILIVDDSGFNRQQLTRFLEKDFEIMTAKDGRAGFELLMEGEKAPDAMLMDIVMPRLDGIQTLRMIRREERWKALPILMISSVKDRDRIIEALKEGASDYMIKPLEREMVIFRLARALSAR